MISLRKAIDEKSGELFHRTLEAYRKTLASVADAGASAYPPAEATLRDSLLKLQSALVAEAAVEAIGETGRRADSELREWGQQAHRYYQEKTSEVKEILLLMAGMASEIADRDQQHSSNFSQLTHQLEASAKLDDLTEIRRSVVRSVKDLRDQVARIEKDSGETVGKLRSQVAAYEARLEEVERMAAQDPLTGLPNRRAMEALIGQRQCAGRPFSVIMLDLNGFKAINDTLGHSAGDDALKQFVHEMKGSLRSSDVVGRWGGDEFIALVEGGFQDAEDRAKRIEEWVNGEYTIQDHKVQIRAAAGIGTWEAGATIEAVLERADAAMYARKAVMRASEVPSV